MNVAILGSTRGTALIPILQAKDRGELSANIKMIISNQAQSGILQLAEQANIPAYFVNQSGLGPDNRDQPILKILQTEKIDLLILIGYMRILSKNFIAQCQHPIINVHPSLLPAHAGLINLTVHQAVIDAKDTLSGCTVHHVNEIVDAGQIILQKRCAVLANDDANTLKTRVQALEGPALIQAIQILQSTTQGTFNE